MEITPFEIAIPWIFSAEGGLANEQADRGGVTNFGISLNYLRNVGDRDDDGYVEGDLDRDGDVDGDDIRIMTREDALKFYRVDFWDAARCGEMPPPIALTLFDARVNHRPRTAARLVQQALGVGADGRIGPVTMAAAQRADLQHYPTQFFGRRALLYARIVETNSTQSRFLRGWFNRLFDLQKYMQSELPQLSTGTGG